MNHLQGVIDLLSWHVFLMGCDGALELGCTGMYFSVTKPWSVLLDTCHLCTDICKHSHLTASCLSVVASKLIRISSEGFWTSLSVIESREPWVSRGWQAPCKWHHINRECACAYAHTHASIHKHTPMHTNTHASIHKHTPMHTHMQNTSTDWCICTHANTYTHSCTHKHTHPCAHTQMCTHTY